VETEEEKVAISQELENILKEKSTKNTTGHYYNI